MLGISIGLPFRGALVDSVASAPTPTAPFISGGAVLLQSNDGTWHFLSLVTDGTQITTSIDQAAASDPGAGYLSYLPLFEPATEKTYRIALRTDGGIITWDVDQTQYPDATTPATQLLTNSADGLDYAISLRLDGANVTLDVNQIPS